MRKLDELHLNYPFAGSRMLPYLLPQFGLLGGRRHIRTLMNGWGIEAVYLAAVVDWFSRRVLAWRLSITMVSAFCVEAAEDALRRNEKPEIFNTDQGSQFTSEAFTGRLKKEEIAISMDGRGRWRDNVFVERIWKSIKYEEVYLHAYESVSRARASLARYIEFYNTTRPHSSLMALTPDQVYFHRLPQPTAA